MWDKGEMEHTPVTSQSNLTGEFAGDVVCTAVAACTCGQLVPIAQMDTVMVPKQALYTPLEERS
jgi:hypothetical protein